MPVRLVVKLTWLRVVKFWDLNYIFRVGEARHVASGTQLDRGKYWSMMTADDIVDSYQCRVMKHILRLVNYCKNTITSTQPTFLTWRFGLYQRQPEEELNKFLLKKIRRNLFNSSSGCCHDSDVTWQEIGRLTKVSDRDRNVKVKMLVVLK